MGKDTKISWADHSYNEWIGCSPDSPACDHCYARELFDTRFRLVTWGPGQKRHRTTMQTRNQPFRWDREAAALGQIHTVFANSASDWADVEVPEEWRYDLFRKIHGTKNLFWLLLTKRPNAALKRMGDPAWWKACFGEDWAEARAEVASRIAIGTTAENQKYANQRLPILARMPHCAGIFISIGPMLGRIDLTRITTPGMVIDMLRASYRSDADDGPWRNLKDYAGPDLATYNGHIPFVIVEGESGRDLAGTRPITPLHPDWARAIRDQCARAGVADHFHFKQHGEYIVPEDGQPSCRVCGCTWNNACHHGGGSCHWIIPPADVRGPLCSACRGKRIPDGERPVRFARVGTKAAGNLLDGRRHLPRPHFVPSRKELMHV